MQIQRKMLAANKEAIMGPNSFDGRNELNIFYLTTQWSVVGWSRSDVSGQEIISVSHNS